MAAAARQLPAVSAAQATQKGKPELRLRDHLLAKTGLCRKLSVSHRDRFGESNFDCCFHRRRVY
jgi:hypothetical protein